MRQISVLSLSIAGVLASALPALAHTRAGVTFAFGEGLTHPFGGIDHLLAMVSVGALAAMIGGRALLAVPLAFLAMMLGGALLGLSGVTLPAVELGVAASVVVLGALIAAGARPGAALAALLVGAFAVFHGYAHGAELPAGGSAFDYFAGFVTASALLHAAGIGLGLAALRLGPNSLQFALRGAGSVVFAVGLVLVMRAV